MPNWTQNQQNAIHSTNGSILVSASAGSGKTAVLVERVISRITDKKNPTPADRMLVVTYTKAAAAEMKERTKGLPVVFNSSYQRASKYWFYSGQMAYSQNSYQKRKNNFNFWPIEDSLLGKPVYYIDYYNPAVFPDSLSTSIGLLGYTYDPGFMSFGKVTAEFGSRKIKIKEGKEFQLQCIFSATDQYKTFIQSHELNDTMRIGIFAKDGKWQKDIPLPWKLKEVMDGRKTDTLLNPAMGKGHYFMRLGISSGAYPPTHNSEKIELLID